MGTGWAKGKGKGKETARGERNNYPWPRETCSSSINMPPAQLATMSAQPSYHILTLPSRPSRPSYQLWVPLACWIANWMRVMGMPCGYRAVSGERGWPGGL